MPKRSAGLLMYRFRGRAMEVFLVHPGGPFWAKKDLGVWSVPKGELADQDDPLETAKREFQEETGHAAIGNFLPLPAQKQPGGKIVYAWAFEGDCDPAKIRSNTFEMEWPPRSGKRQSFPEVDRAAWFSLHIAEKEILRGQIGFLDELRKLLAGRKIEERISQSSEG